VDRADFEHLVRENAGIVRSLVYHILHSPNDVEDVTQEVFLKAYQSLGAFRGGSFKSYVTRIARNHCYDILRKSKSHKRVEATVELDDNLPDGGGTPEEAMIQAESALQLQRILETIPELDREILLMKHVHGFSYDEIAEVLDMKVGTVRTRISRARQRLMTDMQRRESDEPSFLG
jgi:RNA polymerase sigma-70 factor (ECF subfamily)